MKTFREVIKAAGGAHALARKIGVLPITVRQWNHRDNIPAAYFMRVARAAKTSPKQLCILAEHWQQHEQRIANLCDELRNDS